MSCKHKNLLYKKLNSINFDVLNRVKYIGSGYPGKPFWGTQNMACFKQLY